MGGRTMDGSYSWLLNAQLLLVHSLLLTTSLTLSVLSPPPPHAPRSSIPASCRLPNCSGPTLRPRRGGGSRPTRNPIAQLNTSLVNRDTPENSGVRFRCDDGSVVVIRPLLLVKPLVPPKSPAPSLACGFFCRDSCSTTLFSIFLVLINSSWAISNSSSGFPQVVWSANRNKPVGEGARLQLTSDGRLVLSDSGGAEVWSTDTVGKNVSGMTLTEKGNLVLYSSTGETVWQSFDHATDVVLGGQSVAGQRLVANASDTNSTEGKFYLDVTNDSFYASIDSGDTPGMYYSQLIKIGRGVLLSLPSKSDGEGAPVERADTIDSAYQFMRLEHDGHLRLYRWSGGEQSIWMAEDRLYIDKCFYPTVCGEYGICAEGDCTCPEDYFHPVAPRKPKYGCSPSAPLSCQSPETHILVRQDNIAYFGYVQPANLSGTDVESCKKACLTDCSCKAAVFKFRADPSKGDCYLPSRIFSLIQNQNSVTGYNSSAFIKVQSASRHGAGKRSTILVSTLGVLFALLLLGAVVGIVLRRRRKEKDELEGCLPHLPGMPARFSYEELKCAAGNFSRLLGEGGFGSVFLGTLADGMSVAVKLLGGKGQGMKEFLAEVETIGSIHHVNLVRLVGYCAHKQHRLLVYEYMCNGSLDKWIFRRNENPRTLDWLTRHKIILHVAKGLAYLHEECRHRIAHLDIKPENILLDESFNAKVSDFGLSKLIDRDQSQVVTTMRGTPGYLAPEWLSSMITEKVDVFSFGVVVLETVCGRRNIDCSRPKQNMTLANELKSAAEEDRLLDIVDSNCEDIDDYRDEAIKMLRMAMWCLQGDPDRRPPMSAVVKLLEGVMGIEPFLDFNFTAPAQVMDHREVYFSSSTPMLASTLSGPR